MPLDSSRTITRPAVQIFAMPDNRRGALYPDDLDEDGEPLPFVADWLTLPIQMPESVLLTTGPSGELDDVLAIHVMGEEGGQVRREDVQTVLAAILQFNRDCEDRDAPPDAGPLDAA